MPNVDDLVEEAYVYLWQRNASRMRFCQYSRWRATLKYHFNTLDGESLRRLFHRLVARGNFISKKLAPKTHVAYLFTQTPTTELTEPEIQQRIDAAIHNSPIVRF